MSYTKSLNLKLDSYIGLTISKYKTKSVINNIFSFESEQLNGGTFTFVTQCDVLHVISILYQNDILCWDTKAGITFCGGITIESFRNVLDKCNIVTFEMVESQ